MRRAGVIGWPLKTSLSPIFQQAALDELGLDVRFEAWPTPMEQLPARLEQLRQADCAGACVTVPHKQNVMATLDQIDQKALDIGAVNWIINRNGKLIGYNSDVDGFIIALREQFGFECNAKRVLVFGAGGAARAIIYGIKTHGASSAVIINRTLATATALVRQFQTADFKLSSATSLSAAFQQSATQFDLIVNTSSVGMEGANETVRLPLDQFEDLITNQPVVYDLVYTPPQTHFLKELSQISPKTANGISMLIHQGAVGFELMFGKKAPVPVMFAALKSDYGR